MTTGPRAILFACNMNSVRSPMAEAVAKSLFPTLRVESCGVYEGIVDPFVTDVLREEGIEEPRLGPKTFGQMRIEDFDRVIALTPEAAAEARRLGAKVDFWEVENPTDTRGDNEQVRDAYRRVRDALRRKIAATFTAR
jgi:protein-tyrosine-phosphatase